MQGRVLLLLLFIGGARNLFSEERKSCQIALPACNEVECRHYHCLGPENTGANTPVRPKTCNGDVTFFVAGIYWNAHQDGMEYAIKNAVTVPLINPTLDNIEELNQLIEAVYIAPHSNWSFGYKLGLGYNTPCDGWDLGIYWTRFHTFSFSNVEAGEGHSLITLWSAFSPTQGSVLYARDIDSLWKVRLNLVDFELGREYWTSRELSLRPFIGFRYALIEQDLDLEHHGGSWSPRMTPDQFPFNNEVNLDNDYKGGGLRSGIETTWHIQCGWAFYGNVAASIIYGYFNVTQAEENELAISPHTRTEILKTKEHYRASRAILDFMLSVEWSTILLDCGYAITARLGWEHHLFFHQNQLWRVNRQNDMAIVLPNNTGENVFDQTRGTLDTQGWTFSIKLEF